MKPKYKWMIAGGSVLVISLTAYFTRSYWMPKKSNDSSSKSSEGSDNMATTSETKKESILAKKIIPISSVARPVVVMSAKGTKNIITADYVLKLTTQANADMVYANSIRGNMSGDIIKKNQAIQKALASAKLAQEAKQAYDAQQGKSSFDGMLEPLNTGDLEY